MTVLNSIQTENVIDQEDLLKRCMGNRAFAARILQSFQSQLSADLDELEDAIHTDDLAKVAAIAHRVKGSCSNVSACRLQKLAGVIDELAKLGQQEELRAAGVTIRDEEGLFIEVVRQFEPA